MNEKVEDNFVTHLKKARTASAVLKLKLLQVRSSAPDTVIFVFEGDDDKIVYGQWIRRIRNGLRYEAFPCGGKKSVRALNNALVQDLSDLKEGTFFFVDRDFDDLKGFSENENIYVTDMYSVENYLISVDVLEALLRDEFPCHSRPDLRSAISAVFVRDYCKFLQVTLELNKRLYLSQAFSIDIIGGHDLTLKQLASINIGNVCASTIPPNVALPMVREPTEVEHTDAATYFSSFEPQRRFRGKFALRFFREWLLKLTNEHKVRSLGLFGDLENDGAVRSAEFVLSNFAAKSPLPVGLPHFVRAIS